MLDVRCLGCGKVWEDIFVMTIPDTIICECGAECEIMAGTRRRSGQWSDKDAVVVFRDPSTGKIRYPGQNTVPTPAGYERVVMKSLREVEKFERDHNVRNEAMWYDRNGRGFDDTYRGEKL